MANPVPAPVVEVCVGHIDGALAALEAGADRLELCAGLEVGGTTPTAGTLQTVLTQAHVPVRVMLRPRGGDFVHDEHEVAAMLQDLDLVRTAPNPHGVEVGIVTGSLLPDGSPDLTITRRLVEAAGEMPVVFHKAIDVAGPSDDSVAALIGIGVRGLLTSGGMPDALSGASRVAELQRDFGDRLEVVLAGSVRAGNVAELHARTQVGAVHLRAASLHDPADTTDPAVLAEVLRALGR
ncbi:copper homeostasis protein CutC [Dermacoccaceae bacterium W4C1]